MKTVIFAALLYAPVSLAVTVNEMTGSFLDKTSVASQPSHIYESLGSFLESVKSDWRLPASELQDQRYTAKVNSLTGSFD
jgi:hypothetical protein